MDQLSALRERLNMLEEEFRQFRESFSPGSQHPRWRGLAISPMQAVILDALSNGKDWTTEDLLNRVDAIQPNECGRTPRIITMQLHKLRGKLKNFDSLMAIDGGGSGRHSNPYHLNEMMRERLAAIRIKP